MPDPLDESFLTVLINEIVTYSEPFVLVLEDYHLIHTPVIHTGLTFLIDHLPSHLHLVLSSRSDPPLPLARWRASNRLAEIHANILRFTEEEASSFLVDMLGLPLSSVQVGVLVDRTEGWIAGLQLAALSMQGCQDIAAFIADFTGSHHYIIDYLTEEILQRQSEPVQTFLMQTSILDRMCSALCEAVTGQPGCQEMLEHLDRANLFLRRLDDERHWYRYHPLFAEMLWHHFQQAQPDLIPELHLRTSQWYEKNGWAGEAIRHVLVGKDFERAAGLIEANIITYQWRRGEIATLSGWMSLLPDDFIRRRPRLCIVHAWRY